MEGCNGALNGGGPRYLKPFSRQVSGHYLVLEINKHQLCKPVVVRERLFYESVPKNLKEFTPMFQGFIFVQFVKDEYGQMQYIGYDSLPHHLTMKTTKSITENSLSFEEEYEKLKHLKCSLRDTEIQSKSFVGIPLNEDNDFHNPYTQSRLSVINTKLTNSSPSDINEYMILENLTGKYRHPCVLDLKIGTRTYSDIMSPEKVQLHVDRSAISTTSKLGIRFCGMQLYNPVEKCYNLYDKYFGSSLDEITLKEAIKNFVFDSQKYRTDVIEGLIKKLKKLRDIIGQLETYRFFSSSLLVMYEGHQEETFDITATPGDRSNVADIRMIDFANYTHSGFVHDPVSYQGPDKDYMWGLSNLINILESINDN